MSLERWLMMSLVTDTAVCIVLVLIAAFVGYVVMFGIRK